MARKSVPEKVRLLVNFLLGVRHGEIHRALAPYGWSVDCVERGWRLAERAGRARFVEESLSEQGEVELLAFKKLWFPLVRIALQRSFPELIQRLVGGPQLSTATSAALLVEPFLNVLDEFASSDSARNRAARQLLSARGLTDDITCRARTLLAQCRAPVPGDSLDAYLEAEATAERELWDFYVEWSAIARRVIASRSLLRLLGLYKPGRATAVDPNPRTEEEPSVQVLVVSAAELAGAAGARPPVGPALAARMAASGAPEVFPGASPWGRSVSSKNKKSGASRKDRDSRNTPRGRPRPVSKGAHFTRPKESNNEPNV